MAIVPSWLVLFQDFKNESAFPLFMFWSSQFLDLPSAHPNWEDLNMKSEKPSSSLKSLNGHYPVWKISIVHKIIKTKRVWWCKYHIFASDNIYLKFIPLSHFLSSGVKYDSLGRFAISWNSRQFFLLFFSFCFLPIFELLRNRKNMLL